MDTSDRIDGQVIMNSLLFLKSYQGFPGLPTKIELLAHDEGVHGRTTSQIQLVIQLVTAAKESIQCCILQCRACSVCFGIQPCQQLQPRR